MHGLDTSNVSSRDKPSGIWAYDFYFLLEICRSGAREPNEHAGREQLSYQLWDW